MFFYEFKVSRRRRKISKAHKKAIHPYEAFPINNPRSLCELAKALVVDHSVEHFLSIYLNAKNEVLGVQIIALGGPLGVEVSPTPIFRSAILAGAVAIVVAHNHPSCNINPSNDDKSLTERLVKSSLLIGIPILDHLIFSDENDDYYSFSENGFISL